MTHEARMPHHRAGVEARRIVTPSEQHTQRLVLRDPRQALQAARGEAR